MTVVRWISKEVDRASLISPSHRRRTKSSIWSSLRRRWVWRGFRRGRASEVSSGDSSDSASFDCLDEGFESRPIRSTNDYVNGPRKRAVFACR